MTHPLDECSLLRSESRELNEIALRDYGRECSRSVLTIAEISELAMTHCKKYSPSASARGRGLAIRVGGGTKSQRTIMMT